MDIISKLVFCATVHYIWWERNQRLFSNKVKSYDQIIEAIRLDVAIKCAAFPISVVHNSRNQFLTDNWGIRVDWKVITQKTCAWFSPPSHVIALHCDGSLTADRTSYGGVIRDDTGTAILAYMGKGEDNLIVGMELLAIFRRVTLCIGNGLHRVSIRSDSKLAVDILNGSVKCPWNMQVLKAYIISLFGQLQRLEIHHVWRELNQPADFVVAIDIGDEESFFFPPDFPPRLVELIKDDSNRKTYFRTPSH
ncbi:uncharacterized protein LOC122647590 [Telopea speciosissima]|uniref:uncharacterized protein LOC122647590 n=1 Tax=Telopea speciosissima TaxID=54955 RepID=UPI001CC80581|nr:uncharacterized protein LOC122647590 [Telopea speciosissima]